MNLITDAIAIKKILIIDNNDQSTLDLVNELNKIDYQSQIIQEVDNLLLIINKNKYNLVVIEVGLPNYVGFLSIRTIKENQNTKHIPVLVYSNRGEEDYITTAQSLGANDYMLKKTIPPSQFAKLIAKHVEAISIRQNLHKD